MSVSVICDGFGTSTGTNEKRVVPTRNPAGSAACVSSQARCSAEEEKASAVLGMVASSPPRSPPSIHRLR